MTFQKGSALERSGCCCECRRSNLLGRCLFALVLVEEVAQEVVSPHWFPSPSRRFDQEGPSLKIGCLIKH